MFFAEAERYRQAFGDKSYFLIARDTRNYYFNDSKTAFSARPRYKLKPSDPNDAWFFTTMKQTAPFNVNLNPDTKLKVTKVWFNVLVKDGARNIGLGGTGLDLTKFLDRFMVSSEAGVTPMIVNSAGAIQAHPDKSLIDYFTVTDKGAARSTIYRLLQKKDEEQMRAALKNAKTDSQRIPVFYADFDGRTQLFAVASIPELDWFAVTAVDLKAARVLDNSLWLPWLLVAGALLAFLILAMVVAVNRIVLAPLLKLTDSARAVAAGDYDIELPPAGRDELGELTRTFGAMTAQVRSHTAELETRVQERTRELLTVNEQMSDANRKISDSIRYAGLIQNSILPDHELESELVGRNFVVWRPRDVVGGDYYIFVPAQNGCLLGVVDCAGHGVPGAFMTMIAHSSLNVAMESHPLSDPAALLGEMDERLRATLQADPHHDRAVTHMDAGLAYVDYDAKIVTFCGAKIGLYWCDGKSDGELEGGRRNMGGKRRPTFENQSMPIDPRATFYMTTDGLLDQAGGEKGYGFGQKRFVDFLYQHAAQPLEEQRSALIERLETYQGDLPQRDDITVLAFRIAPEA